MSLKYSIKCFMNYLNIFELSYAYIDFTVTELFA
jgi:hypothetical protein